MRATRGEGTRRLIIMVPPQHGKSTLSSQYFPAWFVGTQTDKRIVLASYETSYAETWGRKVRDILEYHGRSLFGISVQQGSAAAGRWDICSVDPTTGIPTKNLEGGMTATGVGGPITGKKADLLLIDDPIKDDEEAQSEIDREKKYQWYLNVSLTRVSERGIIILIQTRWHEADLAGRLIRDMEQGSGEKFDVIRLPGIAEEDEDWKDDTGKTIFSRPKGAPLCPELFSIETLHKRQGAMGDHNWARLYQQRPFAKGGGMFQVDKLRERIVKSYPHRDLTIAAGRGWDLAATEKKDSKRTAGVKMLKTTDQRIYVAHVVLGKWTPDRRNTVMKNTSDRERGIKIRFEHEGGSSGEDQALAVGRLLAGHRVEAVKVSGDKVARADAFAAQVNIGNVYIIDDGTWDVEAYIHELEAFPNGEYKDQVDASSLIYNWIYTKLPSAGGSTEPMPDGWDKQIAKQTDQPVPDWRNQFPGGNGGSFEPTPGDKVNRF